MSGLIPAEFIADLIHRADIVELIDNRVPLKKAGRNYQACCPFHTEKTPSFSVSPQKQFYHCFGCGVSGNAIGFLMAYDRLDFVSAVEYLARKLGVDVPTKAKAGDSLKVQQFSDLYAVLTAAKHYYVQQLKKSAEAIAYLKNRGISGETAKRYGLGFASNQWEGLSQAIKSPELLLKAGLLSESKNSKGYHDKFRERIMFPIHDRRGRPVGFGGRVLDNSLPKYLNSPETPVFHKSQLLYGLYEARKAQAHPEKLLVVEGYMDVVMLAEAGIDFAVATLGTATTTLHIQQLFQQTSQVIFCFDGDNAGQKAALRALETALPLLQDNIQVNFLFLPDGEDPDSVVRKEGKAAFCRRLQHAMPLPDFFFEVMQSERNLSDMQGRAQFIHTMLFWIEKIPAPILREMMLDKLSALTRVERQQLSKFSILPLQKNSEKRTGKLQKTPMRIAIALLLQYPTLAKEAPLSLTDFTLPGSALLRDILLLLQENSQLTTASLLEYWRDKPEIAYLHKLAAWEHGVPDKGVKAEWLGALNHLQTLQQEYDINHLMQKASKSLLTPEERALLEALLAEKSG